MAFCTLQELFCVGIVGSVDCRSAGTWMLMEGGGVELICLVQRMERSQCLTLLILEYTCSLLLLPGSAATLHQPKEKQYDKLIMTRSGRYCRAKYVR